MNLTDEERELIMEWVGCAINDSCTNINPLTRDLAIKLGINWYHIHFPRNRVEQILYKRINIARYKQWQVDRAKEIQERHKQLEA